MTGRTKCDRPLKAYYFKCMNMYNLGSSWDHHSLNLVTLIAKRPSENFILPPKTHTHTILLLQFFLSSHCPWLLQCLLVSTSNLSIHCTHFMGFLKYFIKDLRKLQREQVSECGVLTFHSFLHYTLLSWFFSLTLSSSLINRIIPSFRMSFSYIHPWLQTPNVPKGQFS